MWPSKTGEKTQKMCVWEEILNFMDVGLHNHIHTDTLGYNDSVITSRGNMCHLGNIILQYRTWLRNQIHTYS